MLGHVVEAPAFERLEHFVSLLLDANQRHNLTAIRTPAAVWELHICDALALVPHMRALAPRRVLDLGTGGGLPGLPLACVLGETEFVLLDATRKKVEAVQAMADGLGLANVSTVWSRAEALSEDGNFRARFDLVVARAVASLRDLAAWAGPLVRPGGECWFLKSLEVKDEVAAASAALKRARLAPSDAFEYALPGMHGRRQVLRYCLAADGPPRGREPAKGARRRATSLPRRKAR